MIGPVADLKAQLNRLLELSVRAARDLTVRPIVTCSAWEQSRLIVLIGVLFGQVASLVVVRVIFAAQCADAAAIATRLCSLFHNSAGKILFYNNYKFKFLPFKLP